MGAAIGQVHQHHRSGSMKSPADGDRKGGHIPKEREETENADTERREPKCLEPLREGMPSPWAGKLRVEGRICQAGPGTGRN